MAVITSDGLSLLVGDGAGSEVFSSLKGLALARVEIAQRQYVKNNVAADAWQVGAGTADRRVVLEGEAYASDDAASLRLRTLAMSGAAGNFRLELNSTQSLRFAAVATLYRERIVPGDMKRVQFRLESSAAVSIA